MAQKRIQRELADTVKNPIKDVTVETEGDDLFNWNISLRGPVFTICETSPYAGGSFKIKVEFPSDYPFKAPKVKFSTKIYHPNVDDDGSICIGILKSDEWKPSTKFVDVLSAIVNLLIYPNPDDPLRSDIAELYRNNNQEYVKNAQDWVKKYAM